MWIIRTVHPMLMSFIIFTIDENAVFVSAVYIIDSIIPVMICIINVIPSMNPMFHRKEIDVGQGRSISDFFIMFVMGFFLISCFFIRMMMIVFGLGDARVLQLRLL